MKKHPIDELFARKLAEHRQEPSQKAFEKFQARLQEKQTKRRGGVFAINRNWAYYAAVAGVVAVLTIGVLSQNNTTDNQLAVDSGKSNGVEAIKQPDSPVGKENTALMAKTETGAGIITNETLAGRTPVSQGIAAKNAKEILKTPSFEEKAINGEQPDNTLALNPKEDSQPVHIEPLAGKNASVLANESNGVTSKYNVAESVTLIVAPIEENTLASNAVIGNESNVVEEKAEKEKSFLAKLYGEYKNFKYGEKVDLKKIGMKDAVARVDEGLFKEEREDVRDFVQRRIGRIQKRE